METLLTKKLVRPIAGFLILFVILGFIASFLLFSSKTSNTLTSELESAACESLVGAEQTQCFVNQVLLLARNIGITPAIEKAKEYLALSPELQNECHGIMHSLGEEGYKLYKQGVPLDVNESIIMCTYGFYHGFINSAVLEEGGFTSAQEFCAYINEQLLQKGIEALSECYHGFGHAVVDDHVSTQFQTGEEVVSEALALCRTLSPSYLDYVNCGSGVYNAVANIFLYKTFVWPEIADENPLVFCNSQPDDLRVTCYGYFSRVLFSENERDLGKTLSSIKELVSDGYQIGIIENVALLATLTNEDKTDFTSYIEDCKSLPAEVWGNCFGGLAIGIVQSAQTGHLYTSASAVCSSSLIQENDEVICYESLLTNIKPLITKKEFTTICSELLDGQVLESCAI